MLALAIAGGLAFAAPLGVVWVISRDPKPAATIHPPLDSDEP